MIYPSVKCGCGHTAKMHKEDMSQPLYTSGGAVVPGAFYHGECLVKDCGCPEWSPVLGDDEPREDWESDAEAWKT